MIEYDPPKTRNGFMPGDRVVHRTHLAFRGMVLYTRHTRPGEECVVLDRGGVVDVPAVDLEILDHDPGDPPRHRPWSEIRPRPLAKIGEESLANARSKGFYDELEHARWLLRTEDQVADKTRVLAFIENLWLLARCSLIHSEVSEMVEAIRDGQLEGYYCDPIVGHLDECCAPGCVGKPEGLPSEMADVVIRLADLAAAQGINLDAAVGEKMCYNTTRPAKHGRKAGL